MRFPLIFMVAQSAVVVLGGTVSGCRLHFPQTPEGDAAIDGAADAAADSTAQSDGPVISDAELFDAAVDVLQHQDTGLVDGSVDAQGPVCGDGTKDPGEDCDDGNKLSHDGCSSGCTFEVPTWHKLSLTETPRARWGYSLAYDTDRAVVVLFGGTNGGEHDDTWEFDGNTWTQTVASSEPHPSPRHGAGMAYFPDIGHVILFGGSDGSQTHQDTWAYAGGAWQSLSLSSNPEAREFPVMLYDAGMHRILLYGGRNAPSNLGDTWVFNGNTWETIDISTAPSARVAAASAYDTNGPRTVLFGGLGGGMKQDTWEFDGSLWTEISCPAHPGPRYWAAMSFDPRIKRPILFGGNDPNGNTLSDTWEFDGTTWSRVLPAGDQPGGIGRLSMVYDIELATSIMFGGLKPGAAQNDTWSYRWESAWPDESCSSGLDEDHDGLVDCADPDCEGRRCAGGVCRNGICQ